jgi:hypothetical protein
MALISTHNAVDEVPLTNIRYVATLAGADSKVAS